jgi:hypothetical protein
MDKQVPHAIRISMVVFAKQGNQKLQPEDNQTGSARLILPALLHFVLMYRQYGNGHQNKDSR